MQHTDENRLKALLKLLQTETGSYGPVLKRELAAAIAADPSRVQQVLQTEYQTQAPLPVLYTLEEICWEKLATDFVCFASKINPDLEEGLTLLSKFTSPAVSRSSITQQLDEIARALRPLLLNAKTQAEIAHWLSHYLFQVRGLQTIPTPTDIREMSFARLLRTQKASALCVACLYVTIGLRYGLDINLIDLAGRILVHLQHPQRNESVFIDPLDRGKVLSEKDCRDYISERQLAWNNEFLSPLSTRFIVRRFIANMIYALNKVQDERRLKYLRGYLDIFTSN